MVLQVEEGGAARAAPARSALLAGGFRPFFLLAALHAAAFLPFWLGALAGAWSAPAWIVGATRWHAHEMVFGFATAAICGFLLTAVPVWTASPPVSGRPLAALVLLWLAGRAAFVAPQALPAPLVAALDLPLLAAAAALVARRIARAGQGRNAGFPLALLALLLANAAVHGEALGLAPGGAAAGLRGAAGVVVALVVAIGGRIVPGFTANALRRAGGDPTAVQRTPWAEDTAVPAVALAVALDLLAPRTPWSGAAALVAAAVVAARMSGWATRRVLRDPLVVSLHAGYAWVPVGFALVAAADLTGAVPWTAGLHALTAGAMGGMILAVMTRVALGHTGRELAAPPSAVLAYALVHAGALLRVAGPMVAPGSEALVAAGALWALAFVAFLVGYAPILVRPRVDGRPG